MRLATYSWLAVVLAVASAAIGWLGLAGWMAAVVLVASVGMHVAGNAIGTRLRDDTDRDLDRVGMALRSRPAIDLPPSRPGHLQRSTRLGLLVPVSAGIGGLCGGVIGGGCLLTMTSCSLPGAVLGGASAAVVGGLAGFLAASFIEIVRNSLREAIAAERTAAHRDRSA
ncbi:MAG: hypothetical protein ACK5SI_03835 [Planctomycetia bacterium]|jgi:hypothetical protein